MSSKKNINALRRKLRNEATPAEARLWTLLKNRQLEGRKFRRQQGVGEFIVDFYCPAERLAIELDGQVHEGVIAENLDHERTQVIKSKGVRVIRFENRAIFEHPDWVLEQIKKHFTRRLFD
ncbi:MAG: DUF559 domain-containing protein [Verrucomicrobiota bacterium]